MGMPTYPPDMEEDVEAVCDPGKLQQVQRTSGTKSPRFSLMSYLSDWIFLRTVVALLSHSHLSPSESALKRGALMRTRARSRTRSRTHAFKLVFY